MTTRTSDSSKTMQKDREKEAKEPKGGAYQHRLLIPYIRFIVQTLAFLTFFGLILNIGTQLIPFPAVVCLAVTTRTVGDALAVLQGYLASWETGSALWPLIPLAAVLITAAFIGRLPCGWLCPLGFIQDILTLPKKSQRDVSPRLSETLIYMKYIFLAFLLLVSVTLGVSLYMGVGIAYKEALGAFAVPYYAFSPDVTLFVTLPNVLPRVPAALQQLTLLDSSALWAGLTSVTSITWLRLFTLAFFLTAMVLAQRSWCRYVCPLGALMAILSRVSFLGLRRSMARCGACEGKPCLEACLMKVKILKQPWEKFNDPECILCLECVSKCPEGAIRPKFP